MLKNHHILLKRPKRILIEGYIGGGLIHLYRRQCEFLHKEYRWFDPNPISEEGRGVMEGELPTITNRASLTGKD